MHKEGKCVKYYAVETLCTEGCFIIGGIELEVELVLDSMTASVTCASILMQGKTL